MFYTVYVYNNNVLYITVCFRAAVACLGALFEQLGRMLVGFFKDTLTNMLKAMKNAEVSLVFLSHKAPRREHLFHVYFF